MTTSAMFLRILVVFSGLSSLLPAIPVFIGTNTGEGSQSKGIYQADFDPESGRLGASRLAIEYGNPGFLVLHPHKDVLLAVGTPKIPFADQTGSVAAFSIRNGTELEFLGDCSSGGKDACHLAVDATGKFVAIANYGDGRISWVSLDSSGVPVRLLVSSANIGKGPDPKRQEGTHAHGVYINRANNRLFVPDLGLDRVHVHRVDFAKMDFPVVETPLPSAPGAGPRHLAFSPDEKHVYVINELDSTILAASHTNGSFAVLGTVSTLPAEFSGQNTTAEIEVSGDGRFVYASNRGHDSIAVFRRDERTGTLTLIQHAPCGGKTPRHFKISPCGKWLLCAHQNSGTIAVLPVDREKGTLGTPGGAVSVPSPICILFGRERKAEHP